MSVTGQIEKLKKQEENLRKAEEGEADALIVVILSPTFYIWNKNSDKILLFFNLICNSYFQLLFSRQDDPRAEKDFAKMSKRKRSIGNVKVKKVYSGSELKEV